VVEGAWAGGVGGGVELRHGAVLVVGGLERQEEVLQVVRGALRLRLLLLLLLLGCRRGRALHLLVVLLLVLVVLLVVVRMRLGRGRVLAWALGTVIFSIADQVYDVGSSCLCRDRGGDVLIVTVADDDDSITVGIGSCHSKGAT
jgi:hypothetical protein